MRNPFRSELEAFQFLLVTLAAFAAIAVAGVLGGATAGVPVWALATCAAVAFYLRGARGGRGLRTAPARPAGEERRVLVLAGPGAGEPVVEEIRRAAGERGRVLVVAPTPVSAVRHWVSDVDAARADADRRVEETLAGLRAAGIEASGEVGDEDPLQAIEDALRTFGADEIVIPVREGREAGDGLVAAVRARFALPVTGARC